MNRRISATLTRYLLALAMPLGLFAVPIQSAPPDQPAEAPALIDPARPGLEEPQPVDAFLPDLSERLPEVDDDPSQASQIDFAGGAVRLLAPQAWNVGEIPSGRTILLVLSPQEIPQAAGQLRDGIWMTYRFRSPVKGTLEAELLQLLSNDIRYTSQDRNSLPKPIVLEVDSKPAVYQEFARRSLQETQSAPLQEMHLLARTREGLLTVHLIAPVADYAARKVVVMRMLESIKLDDQEASLTDVAAQDEEESPVVGSWKALQSRLIFSADGQVTTIFDQQKNYAIDSRGNLDYKRKVRKLTGKFVAREDLILITWDDGSRLNYRWHVSGGQLFLTDHHGRVSQLERLFQ